MPETQPQLWKFVAGLEHLLRSERPGERGDTAALAAEDALDAIALEERILYSAVPLVDSPDATAEPVDGSDIDLSAWTQAEVASLANSAQYAAADSDVDNANISQEIAALAGVGESDFVQSREIIFVDTGVADYQTLLEDITSLTDPARQIEIIFIDPTRDGIDQITESLYGRTDVDAVHIVSHGTAGEVSLGSSSLSLENLESYAAQIVAWDDSLHSGADLLIYGCDLAASENGRMLVDSIGALCDCDVAASEDITGHEDFGGDWILEYVVGNVQTDVAFGFAAQASWFGMLDITSGLVAHHTFDVDASDSAGSIDGILNGGASINTDDATDIIGEAKLDLDGSQHVDFDNDIASFSGLAEGTIAAWVRTSGTGEHVIFSYSDASETNELMKLSIIDGKLKWLNVNDGGNNVIADSTINTLNDDNWHHVAVAVSSTGNKLYINGVQATATYSLGDATTNAFFDDITDGDELDMGRSVRSTGAEYFFNGLIDDHRVYDRALTASDILQLGSRPITVTTTSDVSDGDVSSWAALYADKGADDEISFREAILVANNEAGHQTINFDIAGSGTQIITLTSALPSITDAVTIDGTTQTDWDEGNFLPIVIDGDGQSTSPIIFDTGSSGSSMTGLVVRDADNALVRINSAANDVSITGNYIGAYDSDGGFDAGELSSGAGILLYGESAIIGGNTVAERNVIGGAENGIVVTSSDDTIISGNYIGLEADGRSIAEITYDGIRAQSGATNLVIGGATVAHGNVIAGVGQDGVQIEGEFSDNITVQNNLIGALADGLTVAQVGGNGVYVLDGADGTTIADNVILGTGSEGIYITSASTTGTVITGNFIGTSADESVVGRIGRDGIRVGSSASDTTIGTIGNGNVITGGYDATEAGIHIRGDAGTGNSIRGNSIYGNAGLGIDLDDYGQTANDDGDSDSGGNNIQNWPQINSFDIDGSGDAWIELDTHTFSAASNYTVDFYASSDRDGGSVEGKRYLFSVPVPGSASTATYHAANAGVVGGEYITAVATDGGGNSSEFSQYAVAQQIGGTGITDLVATDAFDGSGTLTINDDGGDSAYLRVENGDDLIDGRSRFTFEIQYSTTTIAESGSAPILLSYATPDEDDELMLLINTNGGLSMRYYGNYVQSSVFDYNDYVDGEMHTLAFAFDGTAGTLDIMVDGQTVESLTGLASGTFDTGGLMLLGQEQDVIGGDFGTSQTFKGTYHNIQMYSDLRTEDEVRAAHENGVDYDESGLIAQWTFDGISKDGVIAETTGNDYHLALQHTTESGFTPSEAEAGFTVSEVAENGDYVGTVTAVDPEREAQIAELLNADPDLVYSAETDKFYKLNANLETWDEAHGVAQSTSLNTINGQLVTIRSSLEQSLIHDLALSAGDDVWLGATDATTEDEWRWIDNGSEADRFWDDATETRPDGAYENWTSNGLGADDIAYLDRSSSKWETAASNNFSKYSVIEWNADEVLDHTEVVTFSLTGQTVSGAFAIDSDTGKITVANASNLLSASTHTLSVQATDSDGTRTETFDVRLGEAYATATSDDQILIGGSGVNTITGGAGNDIILGGDDLIGEGNFNSTQLDTQRNVTGTNSGWTVSGGSVDFLGSDLEDLLRPTDALDPYLRVVDLKDASIERTVSGLNIGEDYTVAFFLGADGSGTASVDVEAMGLGATSISADMPGGNGLDNMDWQARAYTFTATSTSHTIRFTSTSGDASDGPIIGGVHMGSHSTIDGEDTLSGGDGGDVIIGGGDEDTIDGGAGDDFLFGGDAKDDITGGAGVDYLFGGEGAERFYTSDDSDTDFVDGGEGSDLYITHNGDTIDYYRDSGTIGTDELLFSSTAGTLHLEDNFSAAITGLEGIEGHSETFKVEIGSSSYTNAVNWDFTGITLTSVSRIDGGTQNDTIIVENQVNRQIYGNDGNDALVSINGTARLDGGDGDDSLVGGLGQDVLVGGAGTDTAFYDNALADFTIDRTNYTGNNNSGYLLVEETNVVGDDEGDDFVYGTVEYLQFSDALYVTSNGVFGNPGAPTLDNTGDMALTDITEDDTNNAGQTVASIIASAGGDRIMDVDLGAVEGIAVTATDNDSSGLWQYSINGGTTWADFSTVTNTSALLLRDSDLVRFNPATQTGASANFTFRAWDQTSGSAGSKVDTSTNGGVTAFSTDTESATITVQSVNDNPTNSGSLPTDLVFTENVSSDVDLSALNLSDVDGGSANLTMKLITSTGGQLTASSGGGVVVGGTAEAMTFTGDLVDLNAYFDTASNIQYLHETSTTFGDNADTITIVMNDNGNSGAGGGTDHTLGIVNVDIAGVNDAPTFGRPTPPTFTADTISAENGAISITTADLDNDGDLDTITTGWITGRIEWHENDGSGNFTTRTVRSGIANPYDVSVGDMDGDGDLDIVASSVGADRIYWLRNDGSQNFSSLTVSTNVTDPRSVVTIDMDGDGDLDVLSASDGDNKIAWHENNGSGSFTTRTITSSAMEAFGVQAIDVDGDGDMDVVSASDDDDTIAWYENDGSQNFTIHVISATAGGAFDVSVNDVDGDGDVDVVAVSRTDNTVQWYENDGSQNFTTHVIATGLSTPRSVIAFDANGDGDVDVLVGNHGSDTVTLFDNDGSQTFSEHTVTSSAEGVWSLAVGDLDGDGDLDVLTAEFTGDEFGWFESDGGGFATTVDSNPTFTEDGSPVLLDSAVNVADAELDALNSGNGNYSGAIFQVRRTGAINPDDVFAIIDGNGITSSANTLIKNGQVIGTLNTSTPGELHVTFTDANGEIPTSDDIANILSQVTYQNTSDIPSVAVQLTWTITDGNSGSQGSGGMRQSVDQMDVAVTPTNDAPEIISNGGGATASISMDENTTAVTTVSSFDADSGARTYSISGGADAALFEIDDTTGELTFVESPDFETPLDANGDNVHEVIVQASDGTDADTQTISLTVTNINETPTFGVGQTPTFTEHTITTGADYAQDVAVADLDGDGDMDVLSASAYDDRISWYENDGSENFSYHSIATNADFASSVTAVDIDGDGDIDVLSTYKNDDAVSWHENDGTGNFTTHTITISANGARSVAAADVDGDGDLDVLSASEYDDTIAWYENDGNENFTITHVVTAAANGASSVSTADVDGDGDLDLLSSSLGDDKIVWYENDGDQSFTAHTITTNADHAMEVTAADVDGDGDMDVLSASKDDNTIAWYENNGSEQFTAHTISANAMGAHSVAAVDVDGDGDLDVVSASFTDDTIAWYQNDSSQNFTTHVISTGADQAASVVVGDVDGDGDLDLLSASKADDSIAWYESSGRTVSGLSGTTTYVEGGAPVVLDADVDVLDVELDGLNGGNGNYAGASLTLVRNGGSNSDDVLGFNDGNGITLSGSVLVKNGQTIATFDTTTTSGELVITFTDANGEIPTSSDVDKILSQITYASTSDAPQASVQIDWTFDDGAASASSQATGSTTVDITSVNDSPVVGVNTGATFDEGSSGNTITSSMLNEADPDDGGAELTYTVTTDVTNGTLRFSGSALSQNETFTQDDIDNNRITYDHDGSNATADSFAFSLADGGENSSAPATGTFNFTITPESAAPTVLQGPGGPTYNESGAARIVDGTTTISDADSTDFDGGVLTTSISAGGKATDRLIVKHEGTGAGQVNVVGSKIQIDGIQIATFSGGVGAGDDLLVTFDSDADAADVQRVARRIAFESTSENPSTTQRTITTTLTDGDGGTSSPSNRSMNVAAYNDNPINSGSLPTDITVTEDTASNVDLSAINFDDVDAGSSDLTVTLSTSTGGQLSASNGGGVIVGGTATARTFTGTIAELNTYFDTTSNIQYLHGTSDTSGNDADSITVVINDGGNTGTGGGTDQNLGSVNVDITNINDAPTLDNSGSPTFTTITEDDANNGGMTVAALLATGAGGDPITDADSGAVEGIAVNSRNNANGVWEYSIDGGTNWSDMGLVSNTSALLLRSTDLVRFNPNGTEGTTQTIRFRAWDQTTGTAGTKVDVSTNGGTTAFSTIQETAEIAVTDINDAPTIATNTGATVDEGSTGTVITNTMLGEGDVDDSGTGLTYTITSETANGTLRLSGTALEINDTFTQDDIDNNRITFDHDGSDTTSDSFGFSLADSGDDGAAPATGTFNFTIGPINDLPSISNLAGDSLTYTEGDGAVVIEEGSDAIVVDVDSTDLDGGNLTAFFNSGDDNAEDVLSIRNQGTGSGQIGVSGSNVTYEGTVIGTFAGGSSGSSLVITFDSDATPAAATALIQNITYENTDTGNPTAGTRAVHFRIADGDGGTSFAYVTSVNVSAANDAPTLDNSGSPAFTTITEEDADNGGMTVAALLATGAGGDPISDADSDAAEGIAVNSRNNGHGVWEYSIDGGTNWSDMGLVSNTSALLLRSTDLIRFNPSGDEGTSQTIRFRAWDQTTGTAGTKVDVSTNGGSTAFSTIQETAEITVTDVNDAPVIATNTGATVDEGSIGTVITNTMLSEGDVDDSGTGLTYTITSETANGTLRLSGSALAINDTFTQDDIDNNRITYDHDGSDTTSDSFGFSLADSGDDGAAPATGTFNFTIGPVNDAPTVNNNPSIEFTEGGSAVTFTDNNTVIADSDSPNLASVTVTLDNGKVGDILNVDETAINTLGITVSGTPASSLASDGTITITLSGAESPADYAAALESITFENDSDTPDTTDRQISIVANDGQLDSAVDTTLIQVTAVNDTPTATSISPVPLAYTENGTPAAIGDSLVLADVDDTNIESATIGFTAGYASGEDVLSFSDQNGITGSYSSASGTWTLSGTATLAEYQAAIRSITYSNTSETPDETTRTVSITINDGDADSSTVSRDINVTSVNDAPTGSVAITGIATEDQTLTASNSLADEDGLGTVSYQWQRDGANIAGATNATYTLIQADVGSTITVVASYADGEGTVESVASAATNTVASTNHLPTAAVRPSVTVTEDVRTSLDLLAVDLNDSDHPTGSGILTVKLATSTGGQIETESATGISITGTGTSEIILTGTATDINNYLNHSDNLRYLHTTEHTFGSGADTIAFMANDNEGSGDISLGTIVVDILPVNDIPTATSISVDVLFGQDTGASVETGLLAGASDAEGDTMSVVLVSGPTSGTLTLNSDGSWNYTPGSQYVAQESFQFAISDGTGQSSARTVTIDILPGAAPPTETNPTYTDSPAETEPELEPELESDSNDTSDESNEPSEDTSQTDKSEEAQVAIEAESTRGNASGSQTNASDRNASWGPTQGIDLSNFAVSSNWTNELNVATSQFAIARSVTTSYSASLFLAEEVNQYKFEQHLNVHQQAMLDFREKQDEAQFVTRIQAGAAAGIVVGATAGIAAWSISGTYLASMAFSAAPAWLRIDPIFVMQQAAIKDEDNTSVADIIARRNQSSSEETPESS